MEETHINVSINCLNSFTSCKGLHKVNSDGIFINVEARQTLTTKNKITKVLTTKRQHVILIKVAVEKRQQHEP